MNLEQKLIEELSKSFEAKNDYIVGIPMDEIEKEYKTDWGFVMDRKLKKFSQRWMLCVAVGPKSKDLIEPGEYFLPELDQTKLLSCKFKDRKLWFTIPENILIVTNERDMTRSDQETVKVY